ncbi:MAG: RIP metalloprotease RseP [Solobacterium sp.]|jgi:regulator of sigma E protease|nr:RIP metalloprotease RseP [Solobacterium sp.]MCH4226316.1 RIP metalloprotease RseP [Solobacterium sp.]
MNFMNIIYFLLLLSLIIVIHELGHFLAAKLFGVWCYEFSFGMGPLLFKHQGKETQFSIRALPIGGYVAMAGEQDGDEAYPDVAVPEGRRLTDKKPWQKIIVMLAGVFNNFVLAFLIFSFVILGNGTFSTSPKAVVDQITEGSPAEKAGFEVGDVIKRIVKEDGSSVEPENYIDMQSFSYNYTGTETYTVERDGQEIVIQVTPEYNSETESYLIGIVAPDAETVNINLLNCWYYGGYEMKSITKLLFTTLAGLFLHGSGLEQMSGPVGIYQAAGTYASMGVSAFMFLVAELSLNVGIFNLLPLPVLDGGQVIITIIEWIAHRPLNKKVKMGIMIACWALLIGFMIFVTWNDISRLFS